jgi:hypothetical protein
MKNALFLIIGGVFVVVCLLSYLGPRTLEAFLDPPEPEPPTEIKKYGKTGDYMLDRSANVLHKQKANDNTQLKRIRDMFLQPNVVEGMDGCGTFGCCEKLNLAKVDKAGSNCNGYCDYNDESDTTPTSGTTSKNTGSSSSTGPDSTTETPKIKCPNTNYYVTSLASCPSSETNPYASNTNYSSMYPSGSAAGTPFEETTGNTDTIFIAPPTKNFGQREVDRLKPYKKRKKTEGKCGVCPEPQPCPACARCPEPSFDCKKVPNYGSTNSEYLPMPILTDFSTFGM